MPDIDLYGNSDLRKQFGPQQLDDAADAARLAEQLDAVKIVQEALSVKKAQTPPPDFKGLVNDCVNMLAESRIWLNNNPQTRDLAERINNLITRVEAIIS